MGGVAYRLRCGLRSGWRSTVWLALLVAVAGGTVLTIAAGAQRTSSAPDRYTAARGGDLDAALSQQEGQPRTDEIAALPGVESVDAVTFVFGGVFGPAGDPLDTLALSGSVVAGNARVVDGREPAGAVPSEFVATRSFVEDNGAEIGDTFPFRSFTQAQADEGGFDAGEPEGPSMEAQLTGVIDSPEEIDAPEPYLVFSPALLSEPELGISSSTMAVDLAEGLTPRDLRRELDTLPDGDRFSIEPGVVIPTTVTDAVRIQSRGLWILTGVVALAVVAVLGQLITRHLRVSGAERSRLAALGFSRRQLVASGLAQEAVPVVGGLAVAACIAVALSGIFPTGFVRRIEPDAGVRFEGWVLAGGILLLLAALLLWGLTAALTQGRARADRPSPWVEALVRRGPSAPASVGMRFAFTRRQQDRGSVGAGLAGVAFTVVGVVAAAMFALSLGQFVADPMRWGNGFDVQFGSGAQDFPPEAQAVLEADIDVEAVALYASGLARVGTESLPLIGVEQVKSAITPPVLSGRIPIGDDEIGLGRSTARAIGAQVGDELVVEGADGPHRIRVSGLLVVPPIAGVEGIGEGSLVSLDALKRIDPEYDGGTAGVVLRSGAPADTADRLSQTMEMDGVPPDRPATVTSFARVRSIPYALAALLGALAVLSVGHVTLRSVQARTKDVAVLRSVGADRRWISRAVHWQATVFTVLAVAIGAPLGLALGRLVFVVFADGVGAVRDPVVPFAVLSVIVVAVIGLANLVATLPAWRARSLPLAALARTE